MNALREISTDMAASFDPRRHVDHKLGRVVLKQIPKIGWVFELFGIEAKVFNDKILYLPKKDRYLAFIADLYS